MLSLRCKLMQYAHLSCFSDEEFCKVQLFVAVAEDSGEYTGVAGLRREPPRDGRQVGEIISVSVRPEFRKRGIGQSLLSHVISVARDEGIEVLELLTLKDVLADAVRLYERNGFHVAREKLVPHYHLLYMEKELSALPE